MKNIDRLTEALGQKVSGYRISRNLKQSELAKEAGIDRTTLARLEKGRGTIDSLARVLLALGLDDRLLDVVPNASINPLDEMSHKGHERKRVRRAATSQTPTRWSWGDD